MGTSGQMRAHSVWPAAFGLFVAWLTYSLAPLWPVLGGLPGSASFYASARIFYYAALFLATLVLAILWNRPCDRSGTLFKSLMLATVFDSSSRASSDMRPAIPTNRTTCGSHARSSCRGR